MEPLFSPIKQWYAHQTLTMASLFFKILSGGETIKRLITVKQTKEKGRLERDDKCWPSFSTKEPGLDESADQPKIIRDKAFTEFIIRKEENCFPCGRVDLANCQWKSDEQPIPTVLNLINL